MNYEQKYLKYKQKYMDLKRQIGGVVNIPDNLEQLKVWLTRTFEGGPPPSNVEPKVMLIAYKVYANECIIDVVDTINWIQTHVLNPPHVDIPGNLDHVLIWLQRTFAIGPQPPMQPPLDNLIMQTVWRIYNNAECRVDFIKLLNWAKTYDHK
jgi:hypothetical protein